MDWVKERVSMASNKRKSERIDFKEKVQVYSMPRASFPRMLKSKNPPLLLKGKNISKDGICMEASPLFRKDQVFQLDFQFFKNGIIHTFAKVVWTEKDSCGLQFLKAEEVVQMENKPEVEGEPKLSNHSNPLAS
jgi:hypothetical protein